MPWRSLLARIWRSCWHSSLNVFARLRRCYSASMPQASQPETFILIPGRTSRQGTTLNEGKFTQGYVEETSTLLMNPEDMARLALKNGDRVRLRSEDGESLPRPNSKAKSGKAAKADFREIIRLSTRFQTAGIK